MQKLKIILTSLCLMNCVACSTLGQQSQEPIIKTQVQKVQPPPQMLADPQQPTIKPVAVTRDVLDNSDAWQAAFDHAVAQIRVLREWYRGQ